MGMLAQIDIVASSSPYKGIEIATSLMTIPRIITAIKLNRIDFGIGDKNLGDTALSYKSFYIFFYNQAIYFRSVLLFSAFNRSFMPRLFKVVRHLLIGPTQKSVFDRITCKII